MSDMPPCPRAPPCPLAPLPRASLASHASLHPPRVYKGSAAVLHVAAQECAPHARIPSLISWQAALFREVASLEAQLAQAQADREESRNWAATYRDMLLKVT